MLLEKGSRSNFNTPTQLKYWHYLDPSTLASRSQHSAEMKPERQFHTSSSLDLVSDTLIWLFEFNSKALVFGTVNTGSRLETRITEDIKVTPLNQVCDCPQ